jgi:hypothetical protein
VRPPGHLRRETTNRDVAIEELVGGEGRRDALGRELLDARGSLRFDGGVGDDGAAIFDRVRLKPLSRGQGTVSALLD